MDFFSVIGRGGLAGLLFGLIFVTWINPGTKEGWVLLLLICVAAGSVCATLFRAAMQVVRRKPLFRKKPVFRSDRPANQKDENT